MKIANKRKCIVIEDEKDNLVKKNGEVYCGCGSNSLKLVSHIDGFCSYQFCYKCECGNVITMTGKRNNAQTFNDWW